MKQAFDSLLEKLRTSLWPVPTGIAMASLGLARLAVQLDEVPWVQRIVEKHFSVLPSTVEPIMTTIAGSVIGVGGVVFSVTMVALTLASGQFGPKVLREYLDSTLAKITLGLFIGTFIYNIVALISVRSANGPGLYLLIGVALAILALFMFVQFIHRSALSIQADRMVHRIAEQLDTALDSHARQADDPHRGCGSAPWRRGAAGCRSWPVSAGSRGYVESIDYAGLTDIASEADVYLKIPVRAGRFVLPGQSICDVFGPADSVAVSLIADAVRLTPIRTPVQDPEFAIAQLNQIALRALSPGINDPSTAITCIDWLAAVLASVVDRDLPNYCFADTSGSVRVIGSAVDFDALFSAMWLPLRAPARGNLPVVLRLMEAMNGLARLTGRPDRCRRIRAFVDELRRMALDDADLESDRASVRACAVR
jgi:uncharacterized membrane protein